MGKLLVASILLCLTFSISSRSQQRIDSAAIQAIERDVVTLLLKEDLGKIVSQLEDDSPATVVPLLRRLILYTRAGRRDGVLKTLKQLRLASDWPSASQSYDVRSKIRLSIANDLVARRYYYEELCPQDTDGAESFIRSWDQEGDQKELDSWLATHSSGDDEWFWQRLYRRAGLGTAAELLEPIKAAIRTNPQDRNLVSRYLRANNAARNLEDVSWLADVAKPSGAFENYELGQILAPASPNAAVKFLQTSLSLPFTERDDELLRFGLRIAITPAKLNAEKQLRFWTKQLLAEAYQNLKRPRDAQPLVEELLATKDDHIISRDVHQLAGGVQRQSGQRAVERKILGNEATQRQTAKYWIERASYYHGRSEADLERDTYVKALTSLPFQPDNQQSQFERYELVRSFAFFLDQREQEQSRVELEGLLRSEFKRVKPESLYASNLARLITNSEFELDELHRSIFVAQPKITALVLARRTDWDNDEEALIEDIFGLDDITDEQKDALWSALEKLITDPGSLRAHRLAEAMVYCGALERAAPLLQGYLKSGAQHEYVDRAEVLRHLSWAYCAKGNWREAEDLLLKNAELSWPRLSYDLGRIATCAAQHGATTDAVRLWRMKVNIDRRDLSGLEELARTEARVPLREFYMQMKKDDPPNAVAELALATLR